MPQRFTIQPKTTGGPRRPAEHGDRWAPAELAALHSRFATAEDPVAAAIAALEGAGIPARRDLRGWLVTEAATAEVRRVLRDS